MFRRVIKGICSEEIDEDENGTNNEKLDEFDENDYPEDSMIGVPLNQKDYDSEGIYITSEYNIK